MAIERLFKSNQASSKYIFLDGTAASFIRGRFHTSDPAQIDQLEKEVKLKHPHIYIDDKEKDVDTEKLDPMFRLREQLKEEIRREEFEKLKHSNDMGKSEMGKLSPSSTTDIAPVAAGGSAVQSAAMAGLVAKLNK